MDNQQFRHKLKALQGIPEDLRRLAMKEMGSTEGGHEEVLAALLRSLEELQKQNDQLRSANDPLQAELRHYRELFDLVPTGYLTTDTEGIIREANLAAAHLFNLSTKKLMGRQITHFVCQDDRESLHSQLAQVKKCEHIQTLELQLQPYKGKQVSAAVSFAALRGSEGGLVELHWLIHGCSECKHVRQTLQQAHSELDRCVEERSAELAHHNRQLSQTIEELKRAERALDERLRFESLLSELSTTFLDLPSTEIDKQIEHGLQRIVEFLGVDRSTLYEISEDKRHFQATHSWTAPGSPPPPPILSFDVFPWATEKILKGEIIQFSRHEDLPDEAKYEKEYLAQEGPKSAVAIPLAVAVLTLGLVVFSSLRVERPWSSGLVQRLSLVGKVFAIALKRKEADEAEQRMLSEIKELQQQLKAENIYLWEEIKTEYNFDEIIGQSDALKYVLFKAEQVAPTDATVVLLGETGTGKELIAHAIHNMSPRKGRPLVKVNCAALPANLIESELFGREKGAFTGAQARQMGRFEIADGGTLFLDEIGELPQELQIKLLRVLQNGEFERLGSPRTIKIDVRIIAATNCNLEEKIQKGLFREDLYYRLQVFPITLPPLRERLGDIPLLAEWCVRKFAKKMGKTIETVPKTAIETLQNYPWPGNVRELENVIERAVINTQGPNLCLMDFLPPPKPQDSETPRQKSLEEVEADYILQTLEKCHWQIEGKDGAASALDLNPSTLRGRMQKLGIHRDNNRYRA